VAHIILQLIRQAHNDTPEEKKTYLTIRKLEVLQLLSQGYVKKEIAEELTISPHTVDKHMRFIYKKLQVQKVASAVSSALRKGWIVIFIFIF